MKYRITSLLFSLFVLLLLLPVVSADNSSLFAFEMGSIRTNGENAEHEARARSKNLTWCEEGTKFSSTKKIAIVKYADKAGSVIEDVYWVTEYELDADCYVRIVVDGVTDIQEAAEAVQIEYAGGSSYTKQVMLNDALDACTGIPILKPDDFEIGAIKITASGWEYSDSLTRVRTKENFTYSLKAGTIIKCSEGFRCYMGYRHTDGIYGILTWFTGEVIAPVDGEYVFLVTSVPESQTECLVDCISDALSFSQNETGNLIPDYWMPEIQDTEKSIAYHRLNAKGKLIEFSFITDVHWRSSARHSPVIMGRINSDMNIPFIIMGGDIINSHDATLEAWSATLQDFYKSWSGQMMFTTIGNHDTNGSSNEDKSTIASSTQMYNLITRNADWIGQVGDETVSYIDNQAQKIRYIQFAYWLQKINSSVLERVDAAINELPADWNVILVSHAMLSGALTGESLAISDRSDSIAQHFLELQQREGKANIICWLCGHTHRDSSMVYEDGDKSLLVINTGCDTLGQTSKWGGLEMKAGTATEHCWDYLQIDTGARLIYCTRVGAGTDRVFRY